MSKELERIAELEREVAELQEEVKTSNECLDMANEMVDTLKGRIAALKAHPTQQGECAQLLQERDSFQRVGIRTMEQCDKLTGLRRAMEEHHHEACARGVLELKVDSNVDS